MDCIIYRAGRWHWTSGWVVGTWNWWACGFKLFLLEVGHFLQLLSDQRLPTCCLLTLPSTVSALGDNGGSMSFYRHHLKNPAGITTGWSRPSKAPKERIGYSMRWFTLVQPNSWIWRERKEAEQKWQQNKRDLTWSQHVLVRRATWSTQSKKKRKSITKEKMIHVTEIKES